MPRTTSADSDDTGCAASQVTVFSGAQRRRRWMKEKLALARSIVTRMDAIFALEREFWGKVPAERLACRQKHVAPLVADLEWHLRAQYARLSPKGDLAKAIKCILKLGRLRMRGPNGEKDEFLLAATAQNLRKLARFAPARSAAPLFQHNLPKAAFWNSAAATARSTSCSPHRGRPAAPPASGKAVQRSGISCCCC